MAKDTKELHTACTENPDMWFSESDLLKEIAIKFCVDCPLKDICLSIAEANQEQHGIWGGKDFNLRENRLEPEVIRCRSGLHILEKKGNCNECRKISQRKYDRKIKKGNNKLNTRRVRKNVIGGVCINGHLLDEDSVTIRSSDQAVLCKKCISNNKVTTKAFSLQGDFS